MAYRMIYWLAAAPESPEFARYESLLTSEEALVFARLQHGGRRAEWLLGRSVAKQVVQRYLETTKGARPALSAISILPDARGAPVVTVDGAPLAAGLSISHSQGSAFCALVGEAGVRVGVDIERIAPRDEQFQRDFFSASEIALVAKATLAEQASLATAIWCGKEAYFKVLGTGLPLETRTITCVPTSETADDWSPITIQGATAAGAGAGSWRVWGGFVLAVVTG